MTLIDWLTTALWIFIWIIAGLGIWLAVVGAVGLFLGRAFRGRDHHYPSPNHPAVRAHKQHVDDRPLDPYEAAAWAQLEEKLR